jgi:outer membrane protein assembly factor BamB
VAFLVALALLLTTADDWPTYLHDTSHSAASLQETTLSPRNVNQLVVHWKYATGGPVAASPTVVDGTVYIGSWDGYEYALDEATGSLRWKTFLGTTSAPTCFPPEAGVTSAATLKNGVIYLGGGDSYWYALDAATGKVLWRVYTGDNSVTGGHYNWSSPLLVGNFAYIGIASFGDCPLVQGQLLKVDLTRHAVVATVNIVPDGHVGGGIWTTPTYDPTTHTIYIATATTGDTSETLSQAILALDPNTLHILSYWQLAVSQDTGDADWGTTPVLIAGGAGNKMVIAANKNGVLYAFSNKGTQGPINLAAGPLWEDALGIAGASPAEGAGIVSTGTFAKGTFYQGTGSTVINETDYSRGKAAAAIVGVRPVTVSTAFTGTGYAGSVRAINPVTGAILWQHPTSGPVIGALAYANGLIVDGEGSTVEVLDASTGVRLYSYNTVGGPYGGQLYGPPSVANGQIFIGGTDGNVYAFGLPTVPPPDPVVDHNCPRGWTCQDIGTPTSPGSESLSSRTLIVAASGTGLNGTADSFRLLAKKVSGDTQVTARVATVPAGSDNAQAGLLVRQNSDPAAPFYAVYLTGAHAVMVQYRTTPGAATEAVFHQPSAAPLYLQIQRIGDQFTAAASSNGLTYRLLPGTTATLPMPASVLAGIAASSGAGGTVGKAGFAQVAVGAPGVPPALPPQTSPCPDGWSCGAIGNPLLRGGQLVNGSAWTVQGSGVDIWSYSDQFHFNWRTLVGDGSVSAHIISQTSGDPYAKAGVMLRGSTNASAPFYDALVTPGGGIVVQYRAVHGALGVQRVAVPGTAPAYLKVARRGATFSAYTSHDGINWTLVPGSIITLGALSGPVLAGLAVASHDKDALSTVTFDAVHVAAAPATPATACPGGWTCADIGGPAASGNDALANNIWTVQGGGDDIWNAVDQFHFDWQTLSGDGSASAHVTLQTNTDPWAKAGVMLRGSLDPGAPFYAALVTPGNGILVEYRTAQGGAGMQQVAMPGMVPLYLKVVRTGATFSAYTAQDGMVWTLIPGSSITLGGLRGPVLAGLAIASHDKNALSTVTFDAVQVVAASATTATTCPGGWTCADIGNPGAAGIDSVINGTWTIQGGGDDIWTAADQFHFDWQTCNGDCSISAHIISQTNTASWAKAGVMLRSSTDPGAPFYAALVTPGNGISVEYRTAQGAAALQQVAVPGTAPLYLKVARTGATFSAYTAQDGMPWTLIPGSSITLSGMSGALLAGLAVDSYSSTALSTVTIDSVTAG